MLLRRGTERRWHHGEIVGGITTATCPAIGGAIAKGLQQDPYWKPFFDGFAPVHDWLGAEKPDVAVVFYNDHGLNFFLDKMPTFAVGAAPEYRNADEGWGIPALQPFRGDPELSWHIIESLVARRVRHHDLPGNAGRPRASRCRSSCCGPTRGVAGEHRADCDQHRAASAAVGQSAATRWARRSAARSQLGRATSASS